MSSPIPPLHHIGFRERFIDSGDLKRLQRSSKKHLTGMSRVLWGCLGSPKKIQRGYKESQRRFRESQDDSECFKDVLGSLKGDSGHFRGSIRAF